MLGAVGSNLLALKAMEEAATLAERRRVLAVLDRLEAEARERIAVADQPPVVTRMLDHYTSALAAYARVRAEVEGE